jgi:hypothetical protein
VLRFVRLLLGVWSLGILAVSYRVNSASQPPPAPVRLAPLPLPAPPEARVSGEESTAPILLPATAAPDGAYPGTGEPPEQPTRAPGVKPPEESEPASLPPAPQEVLPPTDETAGAAPGPAAKPVRKPAAEPPPSQEPRPEALCLTCGKAADSWVEVDGNRVGYCRKHYSDLTPVAPAPTAAPPAAEGGGAHPLPAARAPAAEAPAGAAPVQCQGLTKAGDRCRRKTRDPSGFCYQHRPRAEM